MQGSCYNCDFVGLFYWMWLITESALPSTGFITVTSEADSEYFNNPKYNTIEDYYCPKCWANQ